ncbi:MAG: helix-turn-helix domain-containing protein [Clostridia bacterium]|nr:helix-turn-helix domain-containing protein [Clostridia bacterium]MBR2472833.1 helix-turn-helix domain-containing protein [Clostridia bacterium]
MTIGQRIKQLREDANLTQEAVAKRIGVATQTIFKYEKEIVTNIPLENIQKLADVFGISPAALMGWGGVNNIIPVRVRSLPLIGDIACGKPITADRTFDTYATADCELKVDFALKCKGDSMINARIFDGDTVFIREQDMVENGEIAAVVIGDEATLKRVYYYPEDGKMVLAAENSAYSPLVYQGAELEQIRIIGKAIAFQSNIR